MSMNRPIPSIRKKAHMIAFLILMFNKMRLAFLSIYIPETRQFSPWSLSPQGSL